MRAQAMKSVVSRSVAAFWLPRIKMRRIPITVQLKWHSKFFYSLLVRGLELEPLWGLRAKKYGEIELHAGHNKIIMLLKSVEILSRQQQKPQKTTLFCCRWDSCTKGRNGDPRGNTIFQYNSPSTAIISPSVHLSLPSPVLTTPPASDGL